MEVVLWISAVFRETFGKQVSRQTLIHSMLTGFLQMEALIKQYILFALWNSMDYSLVFKITDIISGFNLNSKMLIKTTHQTLIQMIYMKYLATRLQSVLLSHKMGEMIKLWDSSRLKDSWQSIGLAIWWLSMLQVKSTESQQRRKCLLHLHLILMLIFTRLLKLIWTYKIVTQTTNLKSWDTISCHSCMMAFQVLKIDQKQSLSFGTYAWRMKSCNGLYMTVVIKQ